MSAFGRSQGVKAGLLKITLYHGLGLASDLLRQGALPRELKNAADPAAAGWIFSGMATMPDVRGSGRQYRASSPCLDKSQRNAEGVTENEQSAPGVSSRLPPDLRNGVLQRPIRASTLEIAVARIRHRYLKWFSAATRRCSTKRPAAQRI